MRPAALEAVKSARKDGRWDRVYAGSRDIVVSKDFAAVLETSKEAANAFEELNKTDRYAVLWGVETASPSARERQIDTLVKMLAGREVPGIAGKAIIGSDSSDSKPIMVRSAGSQRSKRLRPVKKVKTALPVLSKPGTWKSTRITRSLRKRI